MLNNEEFLFFIFSSEQLKMRKEVEEKLNRIYKPGQVLYKGKYKPYTDIVSDVNNIRFSDSVIVAAGRNLKRIKGSDK